MGVYPHLGSSCQSSAFFQDDLLGPCLLLQRSKNSPAILGCLEGTNLSHAPDMGDSVPTRLYGEEKWMQGTLEEASPSTTSCLLQPRKIQRLTRQNSKHTHICKLRYKRGADLMIRDYYLKGPTVTDLFVISCNNTDGNEFICINVSVTRTSIEIPH